MSEDEKWMRAALEEAQKAAEAGEVPVGAALVSASGDLLAADHNAPLGTNDPTAHAEIRAMRAGAEALGNYRLTGTTLYVTLEPCAMCAGAIAHARVARLVFAAPDPKGGAILHGPRLFGQKTIHHRPEVAEGPFAAEASEMLRAFFRERRK